MPESSVTAAGRSAPSPDGARSGITALRRGQKKNVPTFSATGRERRFGTQARERHAFRCSGQQIALPASFSGRRPSRHSARTRRTRQSASNNRTRFPRLPPDAPAAFRRAAGRHVSSALCTRLHGTKADLAESLRPSAAGPHGPQCVFPAVQTNFTAPQAAESGSLRAPRHAAFSGSSFRFRAVKQKKESWKTMTLQTWSGRLDLNQRLPAPKAGALPLRHAPNKKGCPAEDTGQPYFSKN